MGLGTLNMNRNMITRYKIMIRDIFFKILDLKNVSINCISIYENTFAWNSIQIILKFVATTTLT